MTFFTFSLLFVEIYKTRKIVRIFPNNFTRLLYQDVYCNF